MKTRIALLLVAVVLVAACKKAPAQAAKPAGGAAGTTPAAVKPVPAQLPEIIARVNGSPIDRGQFERAVGALEQQAGGPVPPDQRDTIYRQLVDRLVAMKLLSQASSGLKITVADSEVDAGLAQIRGGFPNEQAFVAALAQRQMTPDKLKAEIREQLQMKKVLDTQIGTTVAITDADVSDFYTKNPDKFQEPESVHLAHILIRVPENADEPTKKKAKAEAESVLAQIRKGADFAAMAKQHSQDQNSAANGGDIGFVPHNPMAPAAFEQAAFALKPNQLSAVVETPVGFHIIKAFEHRNARKVPIEEVKPQVEQYLRQMKVQEKTNAFVEQLKGKAKVEILM